MNYPNLPSLLRLAETALLIKKGRVRTHDTSRNYYVNDLLRSAKFARKFKLGRIPTEEQPILMSQDKKKEAGKEKWDYMMNVATGVMLVETATKAGGILYKGPTKSISEYKKSMDDPSITILEDIQDKVRLLHDKEAKTDAGALKKAGENKSDESDNTDEDGGEGGDAETRGFWRAMTKWISDWIQSGGFGG